MRYITACDNNSFIKKFPCIVDLIADTETDCVYGGAKDGYIFSFEDQAKALKVISILWGGIAFLKKKEEMVSLSGI